jgi:hypothetical protein
MPGRYWSTCGADHARILVLRVGWEHRATAAAERVDRGSSLRWLLWDGPFRAENGCGRLLTSSLYGPFEVVI